LVGALSTAVLSSALGARTMAWAGPIPGITLLLLAGIAGGILFIRQRGLAETHWRGTVIQALAAIVVLERLAHINRTPYPPT